MRQPPLPRRHERGATLVEVMVAVVVLSLGLFGAAALQLTAMRNNQGSYEQAQMTVLTQGMLDAMRNNLAGVTAGQYEYASWTCAAPAAGTLAANDVGAWINSLQAQLNTSACASITCTGRDCTVGVRWDDSRARGGSANQIVRVRSTL